jgi:hypothetical protein
MYGTPKCNTTEKLVESRKSQRNITIKCPHIISDPKRGTFSRIHTK